MSSHLTNQEIASILRQEARNRTGPADRYASKALLSSADIIEHMPEPITSVDQLNNIRGIGEGTKLRVAKILTDERQTIPQEYDFTELKFFGPAVNKTLHAKGIHTLDQLLDNEQELSLLTENQLAGLRYREHLSHRIPRTEVKEIGDIVLTEAIKLGMTGELVGSFRRGKETSGDVDVLLTGKRNRLAELVSRLYEIGVIRYIFSLGEVKGMFVAIRPSALTSADESPPVEILRRSLDIRFVPQESFGSALLFSTGSDTFNIIQRKKATELGYKLNEYGLFDLTTNKKIPTPTEEEIFQKLDMPFVPPSQRG